MNLRDTINNEVTKVAVIYGGNSAEREISLKSGNKVYESLIKQAINAVLIDASDGNLINKLQAGISHAFIIVHGKGGEDGCLQALLEQLEIPYTGSGIASSAIALDKYKSKLIWQSFGINTPAVKLVNQLEDLTEYELLIPGFVKPCTEGSSIGISKITSTKQLIAAYEEAKKYDTNVILEQAITGEELTVGIIQEQTLPIIQIKVATDFYDYSAKYQRATTKFELADYLTTVQQRQIQQQCLQAFNVLGCQGWGRVDMIRDDSGNCWILEINTVPGMSSRSLVPMAASHLGYNFDNLVLRILSTAVSTPIR